MNINRLESQILFKEKINEGKSENQANEEIERDKSFIKQTKKKLNKIKSLESINKGRKDKVFKEAFRRLTKKKKNDKNQERFNQTIKLYKKRILNRLIETPANKKQLCLDCCMKISKVNEILILLLKENKIKGEQVNLRETVYDII